MAENSAPSFSAALRQAIEAGEIEILFQPQVSVSTGHIVGAEALARWHRPHVGELGAESLIGLAARAGHADELSIHLQRAALCAAADWPQELSNLRLSVNVTAGDLGQERFAEQFLAMVADCGFDPRRLTVEVTETELIENLAVAAHLLQRLRGEGVCVALDDFGTGYSSLLYLKELPLDALKIDKRLTEDITGSERDRIVVRSVIGMAQALGLDVIAEGVETEEQLRMLAAEGCSLYQGYLCSPPVEAGALAALLA